MSTMELRRIFHRIFSLPEIRDAVREYVEKKYSPRFVGEDFMVRRVGRVSRLEYLMQDFVDWWDLEMEPRELLEIVQSARYYRGVLKNILPFSCIYGSIRHLIDSGSLPGARLSWSRVYYVDLGAFSTWEELRRSFSRNVWKNVRHFRNRLNRRYGNWMLERSQNIDEAFRFAIQSQLRKFQDVRLRDADYLGLKRRMLDILNEEELLSLWVLRAEDEPLAVNFVLENQGFAFSYMAGYDASADAYRFLIFHLVKHYYESGFLQFNFMKGESGYKTQWTDRFYRLYRVEFEHPILLKRLLSIVI